MNNKFSLNQKVCIVTGGAGLLGLQHIETIFENGGIPVVIDNDKSKLKYLSKTFSFKEKEKKIAFYLADITSEKNMLRIKKLILKKFKRIDVLINNASVDYKIKKNNNFNKKLKLENFDMKIFSKDIDVGLKGSLICTKIYGQHMAKIKKGVILNVASDLALISPDHRIYNRNDKYIKNVKPITYSIVKHGIVGLTKYTANYWAKSNVRCNAIAPGGIYNNQSKNFVKKISKLIPMGRMAKTGEYKSTILYLISDASSYMTGATISVDGGRTII